MIILTAALRLTDEEIAKLGPAARAQIECLNVEIKKPEAKKADGRKPEAKKPAHSGHSIKDMTRLEIIIFELACTDADSHKAVERALDNIIDREQYPHKPPVVIRKNLKAIAEAVAWWQQKIGS